MCSDAKQGVVDSLAVAFTCMQKPEQFTYSYMWSWSRYQNLHRWKINKGFCRKGPCLQAGFSFNITNNQCKNSVCIIFKTCFFVFLFFSDLQRYGYGGFVQLHHHCNVSYFFFFFLMKQGHGKHFFAELTAGSHVILREYHPVRLKKQHSATMKKRFTLNMFATASKHWNWSDLQ